ncbi:MAG TPA: hypothetical protein VMC80_00445 [Patescibacteria group bacterium]|nr:hypothetical protein [Patescibacteria group bacterium]
MKERTKYISLSIFLISVLLIGLVLADAPVTIASATSASTSAELQRFYDIANAKVNFYSGTANSMTALVPSNILATDISTLQSDLAQIQTYVTSSDRTSLAQFVTGTFQPDLSTAQKDIIAWRQANFKNLTAQQKTSLVSTFTQSKSTFQSSQLNAYKNFANGRVNYFNNAISVYQNRTNNLQAKGIDVSSLTQLLSDAQAQIITPLQNAINSATDASSLNQAVKQYALFDGSQGGTNFHLAAKFNVAELQIALTKLISASVSQTSITQLQTDISTSNSVLTSVGTNQYTNSQQTQLWNSIKDGWNVVKTSSSQVKPANTTA